MFPERDHIKNLPPLMRLRPLFLLFAGMLSWSFLNAQQAPLRQPAPTHLPESPVKFVENKGQWPPHIRFIADVPGGRMFAENNRLVYNFADVSGLHERYLHREKEERNEPISLSCHGVYLEFENANHNPAVTGQSRRPEYHNYFIGNEPDKWASDVSCFGELLYEELYPGIDLRLYGKQTTVKYDLILDAGANANLIRMKYLGPDQMRITPEGKLLIKTSVNEILEQAPYAYQVINGMRVEVPCSFVLDDNRVSFHFPAGYNPLHELVIDPTVVFSTYSGSIADNFGFTATYDDNGDLYSGSIAFGIGYPTVPGSFQTTFGGGGTGGAWTMNGGIDMAISKFNPGTASLVYSTYIGGSANEQPHSLVCHTGGQLYVYGVTWSSNYPTSGGCYDNSQNGGADIVITALNAAGTGLVGSTYVGGSGDDGVNISTTFTQSSLKYNYGDDARGEIILDPSQNVYVASCTRSANFPVTSSAFQQTPGGLQDGCVMKLSPNLSALTWSSYLGGSADDACYSLQPDAQFNVYTTGGTASGNFPVTAGAWMGVLQGNIDGFVTKIRFDGTQVLSSTFAGSAGYDQGFFIQLDRNFDVYIYGQTTGNYPMSAGVWGQAGGGQFITKLNNSLTGQLFSTRFGNTPNVINISPTAFLVDVCGFIYVAGWGGNVNFSGNTFNMPLGGTPFQSTTDGSDIYLLVLRNNASTIDYATYMGGTLSSEHVDGGTSRFNKFAEVYHAVCGGCWSNSDFPTVNPYSATNNSSGCNLACFKIEFPLAGIIADFDPIPDTAGCAPHAVFFDNNSLGGVNFTWTFGDGPAVFSGYNANHTYTTPGTYTVMLVANDPASCNINDTAYATIVVLPDPVVNLPPDTTICSGNSVTINATGANGWQWIAGTSGSSSSVTVSPAVTTTYTVVGINGAGCDDTASVTVTVIPSPTANAGPDQTICPGDTAQLNGSGGGSYSWTPAGTLTNPSISNPQAFPPVTTTYTLTVTAANTCTDQDQVTVTVAAVTANAGPDQVLCAGDTVQLNAGGGTGYAWSPADSLSNPGIANPFAWPGSTTTYTVTVSNAFGCLDTDQVTVTVNPLPVVDAFPFQTICQYDTVQIFATGASSYSWSPPTGLSSTTSASPFAYPVSTIVYTVVGTDGNNCSNWDTVTVNVLPVPLANAGVDVRICEDSTTQLNGSGGGAYLWMPNTALSPGNTVSNPFATPTTPTWYVLEVTAPNGCKDIDSVLVDVTPTPVVNLVDSVPICYGQGVRLIASGGQTYLWSTGDTGDNIYVMPDSNAFYFVTTWVDGCPSLPDTAFVTVDHNLPIAAFDMDPDSGFIPLTVNFINQSQNATHYSWLFGTFGVSTETNPTFTFVNDGVIGVWLVAFNENGCSDTAFKLIIANDWVLWVPNVFTPNGDGFNDYFITPWMGIVQYNILIFDRWGMLIYESNDPDFRWDGFFQNEECQEGVYTFVISGTSIKGSRFKKAGTVTLIR